MNSPFHPGVDVLSNACEAGNQPRTEESTAIASRPIQKYGTVERKVEIGTTRSEPRLRRHPMTAPIRVPRTNEMIVDRPTRPTVQGRAPPMTSVTGARPFEKDRKSTRLNSSHVKISYAVFCLKKKKERRLQH